MLTGYSQPLADGQWMMGNGMKVLPIREAARHNYRLMSKLAYASSSMKGDDDSSDIVVHGGHAAWVQLSVDVQSIEVVGWHAWLGGCRYGPVRVEMPPVPQGRNKLSDQKGKHG